MALLIRPLSSAFGCPILRSFIAKDKRKLVHSNRTWIINLAEIV